MTQKISFVFPGQGSQSVGMLRELSNNFPLIKDIYGIASEALHYDLWSIADEGPEEILNQTEYAQPSLLAAEFAIWNVWLKETGAVPSFLAGHSLGEYTALVCAGALDFVDALKLVSDRARFMQEASPVGKGAMVAIVGLPDEKINEICKNAALDEILSIANYNSIGQVVLAGENESINRAAKLASDSGAKLVKILSVSVPSHCLLMKDAAAKLTSRLNDVVINEPNIPVINNVDVASYQTPEKIRDALVRQLYSPVRWVETVLLFVQNGVDVIIECGPGKVLTGLNKRIAQNVETMSLGVLPAFLKAAHNYKGEK